MCSLIIGVLGGLAIFIYGMTLMSDGLNKIAGEKLRSILGFFASNRFVAIMSGTFITAIIQSSSATTVMVIGFVNAGLLNLVQSIGIIFGANIGTTVTAQLVAFEVTWLIMPAIILGLLLMFVKKTFFRGWGDTILGFGFLFLGMELMTTQLKELSKDPAFLQAFTAFDCAPVGGTIPVGALLGAIGVGLAATMIIQSSSAATGIIIALGGGGIINLYTAIALVLGSNIGTTVTAQLAALTANRTAKQAAMAHTLFNCIGVLLIVSTFWWHWGNNPAPIFFDLVTRLSSSSDIQRHIANAHTIFNVITTLVLWPFIPLLANLCMRIIPQTKQPEKIRHLELHLLNTPEIAISQARNCMSEMFGKAWNMVSLSMNDYLFSTKKIQDKQAQLNDAEVEVDQFQAEITDYLTELTCRQLTTRQAATIPKVIHCINDAERIGDHAINIVNIANDIRATEKHLSASAKTELANLTGMLASQAHDALLALKTCDKHLAGCAVENEKSIIAMADKYESNHLKRMAHKECTGALGVHFVELLSECRDVARHISNIAERSIEIGEKLHE